MIFIARRESGYLMGEREIGWDRIVAHADMDAFYASIEQLDDAALRGRPILVGSNSGRGVVLTASYEARPFGVGSAMPMARARRRCPDAVVVPPRFARYREVSAAIMAVFSDFSPHVEALSLDEAFLDMSGAEPFFGAPERMGRKIKEAVREVTGGLTASVGLSGTKYVAKVASGYRKPDGLTVVPPAEARRWLAPLPLSRLWGAGPKTQAVLFDLGLCTIGDVAGADPEMLRARLGNAGAHFVALAHGEDPRRIVGRRRAKSIGSERTLGEDVVEPEEIQRHLRRSADEIARRLRQKGFVAAGVQIKLKTSEFQLLTRQCRLTEPSDVAATLHAAGVRLLAALQHPGPFRLVGMAAFDLGKTADARQLDLLADRGRGRRLEATIDEISARFGDGVVVRATDLLSPRARRPAPNLDFLDEEGRD
jgi:DNA polymerase-4